MLFQNSQLKLFIYRKPKAVSQGTFLYDFAHFASRHTSATESGTESHPYIFRKSKIKANVSPRPIFYQKKKKKKKINH
jgi:hypothetical protein